MADEPSAETTGLVWLSNNIGRISALLTTLVGLPSLLFTCSSQQIDRNRSFHEAATQEEKVWHDLYDAYLASLTIKNDGLDAAQTSAVRIAKLKAVCEFANRPVPDFSEYELGRVFPNGNTPLHEQQRARIKGLKSGLIRALQEQGVSPTKDRCVVQAADDTGADETEQRKRVAPTGAPGPATVTADAQFATKIEAVREVAQVKALEAAALAPASATLSAGSPTGYDIDIFWCRGANEDGRFGLARQLGLALGKPGLSLGPGAVVGRVRLRALSVEKQMDPGYPSSGYTVRAEASEAAVGNVLARLLSKSGTGQIFTVTNSAMKTPWYLSAFVCSAPSKP